MNKLIAMTKVALVGGLLASGATGCCLFGNDRSCDKTPADKTCCCTSCRCKPGCEKKTTGVNTSMTLGVGTDGISVGHESNVGSHGASASLSTH